MRVELFYCPGPGQVDHHELQLQAGATLGEALQASGVLQRHALHLPDVVAGVWSKVRPHHTVLCEGDRVEVYRPLTVDPKEARRLRYRRQGKKPYGPARTPADEALTGSPR